MHRRLRGPRGTGLPLGHTRVRRGIPGGVHGTQCPRADGTYDAARRDRTGSALTQAPVHQELWNRIAAIDLRPVVSQLIEYLGWTPARVASAERRYRRFLYLKATLPEGNASPTREVDEFWHQHIINTRRYGHDREAAAGRFLHHTFLPADDPAQAGTLSSVWLNTLAAYELLFAEPYEETIGAALLRRWPKA